MNDSTILRLTIFGAVLVVLALAESLWPRRRLTTPKGARWLTNLGLVAIDTVALRWLLPLLPVGMAALAQERGWGLLPALGIGGAAALILSLLLLDLTIYLQHRAFHRFALLWRLHRVHHTDLDLDVSSGNRFHPLEIALSAGIKLAAVALLGSTPAAVVLFEIGLNAAAMFNHANLRLPLALDRRLRLILVTPDMHRVHHSVIRAETDSNFGFSVPWWDRLFATYCDQPARGHAGMTIGLKEYRDAQRLGLAALLWLPFR